MYHGITFSAYIFHPHNADNDERANDERSGGKWKRWQVLDNNDMRAYAVDQAITIHITILTPPQTAPDKLTAFPPSTFPGPNFIWDFACEHENVREPQKAQAKKLTEA